RVGLPRQTACRRRLRLVTQTLLVPILLHPLAAFVLGDFSFASFFERTHSGKINLALAVRRKASIACAEWQTVSPSKSRDQHQLIIETIPSPGFQRVQTSQIRCCEFRLKPTR